jgi:hypothetical protein
MLPPHPNLVPSTLLHDPAISPFPTLHLTHYAHIDSLFQTSLPLRSSAVCSIDIGLLVLSNTNSVYPLQTSRPPSLLYVYGKPLDPYGNPFLLPTVGVQGGYAKLGSRHYTYNPAMWGVQGVVLKHSSQ